MPTARYTDGPRVGQVIEIPDGTSSVVFPYLNAGGQWTAGWGLTPDVTGEADYVLVRRWPDALNCPMPEWVGWEWNELPVYSLFDRVRDTLKAARDAWFGRGHNDDTY